LKKAAKKSKCYAAYSDATVATKDFVAKDDATAYKGNTKAQRLVERAFTYDASVATVRGMDVRGEVDPLT